MKIAICGTAPSSAGRAPYNDPSWAMWCCSPGLIGAPRIDAWFEIHPLDEEPDTGYVEWVKARECPVWLIEAQADFPTAKAYPIEAMIAEFGPWFFTSTIAYMMALAIVTIEDWRKSRVDLGADGNLYLDGEIHTDDTTIPAEIGLWGVDMAATEEYGTQRAGCHYFIHEARKRGIKVTAPPESDILRPYPLYGFQQASPMWRKLNARRQEILGRKADAENRQQAAANESVFLSGVMSDLDYIFNTWIGDKA